MNELIKEIIMTYGLPALGVILTSIASYVGIKIKALYEKYVNDKIKKDVANTCVKAIEQVYKDLHGEEKYNKAVESITEMLNQKGISITELEIKMLVESTCNEFNKALKEK